MFAQQNLFLVYEFGYDLQPILIISVYEKKIYCREFYGWTQNSILLNWEQGSELVET